MKQFFAIAMMMGTAIAVNAQSEAFLRQVEEHHRQAELRSQRARFEAERANRQHNAEMNSLKRNAVINLSSQQPVRVVNHTQPAAPKRAAEQSHFVARLDSLVNTGYSKYIYTYDNDGNKLSEEYRYWSGHSWVPSHLYQYTYDNEHEITSEIDAEWSWDLNDYKPTNIYYNKYVEGSTMRSGNLHWDDEHQDWYEYWTENWDLDENGYPVTYNAYGYWDFENWQRGEMNYHWEAKNDEYGQVLEMIEFNCEGGVAYPTTKYEYAYDQYGDCTKEYVYTYENDNWRPQYRYEHVNGYFTDQEGFVVRYTTFELRLNNWIAPLGWATGTKYIYTLDETGRRLEDSYYNWNPDVQDWTPDHVSTWNYAADGTETAQHNYSWRYNSWQEGYKYEERFDDHGSSIFRNYYNWNADAQDFVSDSHDENLYTYVEHEDWTERIALYELRNNHWDDQNKLWQEGYKIERTLNERHQETSYAAYTWDVEHQAFVLNEDVHQTYDAHGNCILKHSEWSWNAESQAFDGHEKWTREFDANDNMTRETHYDFKDWLKDYILDHETVWQFDLSVAAADIMGLGDNYLYKNKINSEITSWYDHAGNVMSTDSHYFFYSDNTDSGIQAVSTPATISINAGVLNFKAEQAADITIHSLDGKLVASANVATTFSHALTAGTYVVTVNGQARNIIVK